MASKVPAEFFLQVTFKVREDGGLEARCDKVPNFFLSHSDPEAVRADVEPALSTILSEWYGLPMIVRRLPGIDEALDQQLSLPAHICGQQNYLGRIEA